MKPIQLKGTKSTPSIILDIESNEFVISGCSRPENVRDFFMPVINWFEEIIENFDDHKTEIKDNKLTFDFKLSYFNSASAKFILDILLYINKLSELGVNVGINWHYEEGDDDMHDVGEELAEMVDFDFEYIEMEVE